MLSITEMTDQEVLHEMGRRIREYRLARNLTAEALADRTGLSIGTVLNAEKGRNPKLETVVRILRVLGRLENLNAFLPEPTVSPMDLLKRGSRKKRQRASSGRKGPGENG